MVLFPNKDQIAVPKKPQTYWSQLIKTDLHVTRWIRIMMVMYKYSQHFH